MSDHRKACIIYVPATAGSVAKVRAEMEEGGFSVCEADAAEAAEGLLPQGELPQALVDCMDGTELCIFLLPAVPVDDGLIDACAAVAGGADIRMIGAYAGARDAFPEALDEQAESIVRVDGPNLAEAISGSPIWEKPDGQRAPDREISRVRCQ
ncbi:hypothetical protein ACETK8_10040 [Brevundimonas staleyi]|uniref:Uncharacterized protein n=1 Tax=Brevundimonas staleyi TaxID=74326 RepID=A0ABW0FQC4_9CAUL